MSSCALADNRIHRWLHKQLLFLTIIFAVMTIVGQSQSGAQTRCPWLNEATAAGFLGGEVVATVTEPAPEHTLPTPKYSGADQRKDQLDTNCEFRRQINASTYSLIIKIKTLAEPARDFATLLLNCSAKAPLTGIGNEAFQCRAPADKSKPPAAQDEVIARVRNRAFILTIDYPPNDANPAPGNQLRSDTRNLAEQIAGSLF